MDKRYQYQEDIVNDCITICDNEEKLKTSFGSEIILSPMEDAGVVIDELNIQCAIVSMLKEQLEYHEDPQDVQYWIDEVRSDFE